MAQLDYDYVMHPGPKEPLSLLDVFMPNDLCARCDENEASIKFSYEAQRGEERVKLHFCGRECLLAFIDGVNAARRMQNS